MPGKMASRTDILNALRSRKLAPAELPSLAGSWITYADRRRQFSETLQAVGGRCVEVAGEQALRAELARLEPVKTAKKICSLVPGHFAVAENAAVWVTDENLRHRAILFIVQHLVLVVPCDQVVDNMHQAYERLRFEGRGYGVFISGPSKTADIEQSLVIGAHGPRSLTVFLLGRA